MSVYGVGSGTSVGAVGAATWSGASRVGGPGSVDRMQAAVSSVARMLNASPGELVRQLGQGQSLASVAASRGVSSDALMATVSKAVSTAVPQGAQPLSGNLLSVVSDNIANNTKLSPGFLV